MKKLIIGNQAVAYGALEAGVDVVAGYPGTPSSEALTEILHFSQKNRLAPHVEWSINEKVAFEVATGAAWSGKRALATMKMSGANVASDSILSVAYSGTKGGLLIYIADDPGAEAGMPEQDTRVFTLLAGLPLLEASCPQRAYELAKFGFELSEKTELPVILRLVTSVAHAREEVQAEFKYKPLDRTPRFEQDIFRFTKAGSAICIDQHKSLLTRLKQAERIVQENRVNQLHVRSGKEGSGLFAVGAGSLIPYLKEALSGEEISTLLLESIYPLDEQLIASMLEKAHRVLILEELEPVVEMLIRSTASKVGWCGTILGKLDGLLPRTGKYSQDVVLRGLEALKNGCKVPQAVPAGGRGGEKNIKKKAIPSAISGAVKHPITFCAGCPHRGTYMALNRALKKNKLDRNKTVVTGDIGCTILGMNPPFNSCWTEVSMGSSIGLAQGFFWAGIQEPIIATIGDSTFFHAGIPPLINAIQHRSSMLLIILDNGWTSMTGFQVNPGTEERFQEEGSKRVDIAGMVRSLGVDELKVIRPFDQEEAVETIGQALLSTGVRVIISQEECALTVARREEKQAIYEGDPDKCTFCRACLRETGCPALYVSPSEEKQVMAIDPQLCTGCGLCRTCCKFEAIHSKRLRNRSDG
ncbi:hypothetical protein ES703_58668 [subsurface metagenome]